MSERQQDALLDRIETRRRRRSIGSRVVFFALCTVAAAVALTAAYLIRG